jgi:hypothetical protein
MRSDRRVTGSRVTMMRCSLDDRGAVGFVGIPQGPTPISLPISLGLSLISPWLSWSRAEEPEPEAAIELNRAQMAQRVPVTAEYRYHESSDASESSTASALGTKA